MASINLPALRKVIAELGTAAEDYRRLCGQLRVTLESVGLEPDPANPIARAGTWCDQMVPDLERRLALAEALIHSQPGIDGSVATIDEDHLSTRTPYQARRDAREIGEAIRSGTVLTETQLARLAQGARDPHFARELARETSPQDLAEYTVQIAELFSGDRLGDGSGADVTDPATYETYLQSLGAALGTATRAMSPEELDYYVVGVAQSITGLPNPFATDQPPPAPTGLVTPSIRPGPPRAWNVEPGRWDPRTADALSMLLFHASVPTDFGVTIAEVSYRFDRQLIPLPADLDWHYERWANTTAAAYGLPPLLWPDTTAHPDVLSGVMGMLGHSPDAAQRFFSTGPAVTVSVPGSGEVTFNERLHHLLTQREWPRLGTGSTGLGQAIHSAAGVFRNRDATGQVSAEIATQHFLLTGHPSLSGRNDLPDSLPTATAHVLFSYSPDLFRLYGSGGRNDELAEAMHSTGDWLFGEEGPYGAALTKESMNQILRVYGDRPDELDLILGGWAASVIIFGDVRLAELTVGNESPGQMAEVLRYNDVGGLEDLGETSGAVLRTILGQAHAGLETQAEIDAASQESKIRLGSITAGLMLLHPKVATARLGAWAFGELKNQMFGALPTSVDLDTTEIDGLAGTYETIGYRAYVALLLRHGYLDPAVVEAANDAAIRDHAYQSPFDVPGLLAPDETGHLTFAFETDEYREWASRYRIDGAFRTVFDVALVGG